ncbi:MAG: S8 family serine peptidase [Microbacterium sp.]|uniref:S8 family serine peptidase n=1 Tax=Microbacterium sp. TaxID=51671 RepID=UPI001AD089BB|nr:S8 family serine peptidase [Microbacterium sp.]MBN9177605.1 S8 family serine peptidase [Microbacterium sp.]
MIRTGVAALVLSAALSVSPGAAAALVPSGATTGAGSASAALSSDECTASTWISDVPTALSLLQSEDAWTRSHGSGVVVAVVDSGVAASNPHFVDALVGGADLVGDGVGATADLDGHGTALAGQIAARSVPKSGVVGLAPRAQIMPVRVYAGTSEAQVQAGIGPRTDRVAQGIRYAAEHGARVILVGVTTDAADAGLADAVAAATAQGSLVVASAGSRSHELSIDQNEDDGVRYPAGVPGALGVAATDAEGVVAATSIHGPHVSLSAPGTDVLTTSAAGADCRFASEPSPAFAAAYVAGAAALVAAAHPDESPAQWAYRLEATGVRADPDARDDAAGWGIVQPYDAMILVPGAGVRGPESPFPSEASPAPARPSASAAVVEHRDPANGTALVLGVLGGVAAAVVLGVAGTIGVLRRRRAEPDEPAAVRAGGLFRDERAGDSDSAASED